MNATKDIPEILLLCINFENLSYVNEVRDQSHPSFQTLDCDWSRSLFIEVNK